MKNMNEITKQMRLLRIKKGLTQSDAADLLGVSTNTYNSWETNPYNCKYSTLKNIFDALGEPFESIFFKEEFENNQIEKTQ